MQDRHAHKTDNCLERRGQQTQIGLAGQGATGPIRADRYGVLLDHLESMFHSSSGFSQGRRTEERGGYLSEQGHEDCAESQVRDR